PLQDTLRNKDPGVTFSAQLLHNLGHRHGPQVCAPTHAESGGLRCRLTVTDYEHVGDLAQLSITDLGVHAVTAMVHFDTQALGLELCGNLLSVGHVAVCDGNNHSLRGRQPEREVAFVFLNEESDHTLHGREDTTVYYDGLGPTTVLRDVLELALGREM